MHFSTVDYAKREGRDRARWQAVNLGFFLHGTPRLTLWCRLFGHRPVVDGTEPIPMSGSTYRGDAHRWTVCDRCGVRGDPQGSLDPGVYDCDDRYAGPWRDEPLPSASTPAGRLAWTDAKRDFHLPGRVPKASAGAVGGQVVVGGNRHGGVGWEIKVGNGGSEHTLAASFHLGWVGALYLHTEGHGTGLQRRLNPTGYESRVTGVRLERGALAWKVWSKRDSGTRRGEGAEPWWRNGEIRPRPIDRVLGRRQYTYVDVGEPLGRLVRMPEGDNYLVVLKLQRCTLGRARGRKRLSWNVDWSAAGRGIPTKGPERGRIFGSGVAVSDRAVRAGTWPSAAVAAIAVRLVEDRTGYGWEPLGEIPIPAAVAA